MRRLSRPRGDHPHLAGAAVLTLALTACGGNATGDPAVPFRATVGGEQVVIDQPVVTCQGSGDAFDINIACPG